MTLDEARTRIGRSVVYRPCNGLDPDETGVIASVGERYVFVRYGNDEHGKATSPAKLELTSPGGIPRAYRIP